MGVSGCGKSTIGKLLSKELKCGFLDADDFHSEENKSKMSKGIPLTDDDRMPWLLKLNSELKSRESTILSCSALKEIYREIIFKDISNTEIVLLHGSQKVLAQRLNQRVGHFMNPQLLESQLAILEKPALCIEIDCIQQPSDQIKEIVSYLL